MTQHKATNDRVSPQEKLLAPLEKIWNMGLLRLKFQLCQPGDPLDYLCRQLTISRSDLSSEGVTLLDVWLNTKEREWKR